MMFKRLAILAATPDFSEYATFHKLAQDSWTQIHPKLLDLAEETLFKFDSNRDGEPQEINPHNSGTLEIGRMEGRVLNLQAKLIVGWMQKDNPHEYDLPLIRNSGKEILGALNKATHSFLPKAWKAQVPKYWNFGGNGENPYSLVFFHEIACYADGDFTPRSHL